MKRLKAIRLNENKPGLSDTRLTWAAIGIYHEFVEKEYTIDLERYCIEKNLPYNNELFKGLESLEKFGYCYYFKERRFYILFNEPVNKVLAENEYQKIKVEII